MRVSDLVAAMERIAPTAHAESWDNVGLLVGDPGRAITRVLLTIDYTPEVERERKATRCDAVVAYHPPIFEGLKRVVAGSPVFDALSNGVAVYSPHTALDVASGGTNDVLADALGLEDRVALRLSPTKDEMLKLIVFVPHDHVEAVSRALFDAGAGHIGDYRACSFRSPGTGTFFGGEGTNPAVGESGKLERVEELRVETILPLAKAREVVAALRSSHPYEEPAFDLVRLAAHPTGVGIGRIGRLPSVSRADLFDRIKRALATDHLLVAGPTEGHVDRAAVCAGAGGELLRDALAAGARFVLTGEMRHHDALRAASKDVTVVCTRHSVSERAALDALRVRLKAELPGLEVEQSRADADPFLIR